MSDDKKYEIEVPLNKRGLGRTDSLDIAERISCVADRLAVGESEGSVRDFAQATWQLSSAQARQYVKKAKEYIRQQIDRPRKDYVAELCAFYRAVIFDPGEHKMVKLQFAKEFSELMGLYAPKKLAVSGSLEDAPMKVIVKFANELEEKNEAK